MKLENVTVIIPAHNRPERLQRLLDYYRGTDIKLLIPDSSTLPFTGDVSDPDVTYRHFPKMHFLLKIKEVMPLIKTDYVLYCADDDFAVPAAIERMAEFLHDNPDYSVAQGHYLTFVPSGKTARFYPRYIRYFDSRITAADAQGRLNGQKCIYASMLYGVTRTDLFRKIYSYCFDAQGAPRFRNLFLAEEFFNNAMLIQGKYATLPYFFSAREQIKGSATETTVPIEEVRRSAEYDGYVNALAEMLRDTAGLSLDDARAAIRAVCTAPKDAADVSLKRRIVMAVSRRRWLRPLSALLAARYNAKGLRIVRDMPSYPCTAPTPETAAILRAIASTPR